MPDYFYSPQTAKVIVFGKTSYLYERDKAKMEIRFGSKRTLLLRVMKNDFFQNAQIHLQ